MKMNSIFLAAFFALSSQAFACDIIANYEMKLIDSSWGDLAHPKVAVRSEKKDSEKFSSKRSKYIQKKKSAHERYEQAWGAQVVYAYNKDIVMNTVAGGCRESALDDVKWYSDLLTALEGKFGRNDVYEYLISHNLHFKKITTLESSDHKNELVVFSNKDKKNFAQMVREEGKDKRLVVYNEQCKIEKIVVFNPGHNPQELSKDNCTLPELCSRYQDFFK